MARHKLSAVQVKNEIKPGRHSDGGGLYLNISKSGSKAWVFMWKRSGRRREMGLGSVLDCGLSDARKKAEECRQVVLSGGDPIRERNKSEEPTFLECAQALFDSKSSTWKNPRHAANWQLSLFTYAKPLHRSKVSEIDTPDILRVLKPIWLSKYTTASILRSRIEAVEPFGAKLLIT